jgi:hypothetical protein
LTYSNGLRFQEGIEKFRLRAAVARATYRKTFLGELQMLPNKKTKLYILVLLMSVAVGLVCASSAVGATLNVPGDYATIQDAIDAAVDGDTIQVAAGTYSELLVWDTKCISLVGAGPGSTIVDAQGTGRCLHMTNVPASVSIDGVTFTARVDGFTFTGGMLIGDGTICPEVHCHSGGGLYLNNSSPTLENNAITGNSAASAGGLLLYGYSDATLTNNTISNNDATGGILEVGIGGGIVCAYSSPTITSCTISNNSADYGGGLYIWDSSAILANNIVSGNLADIDSGGMYIYYSCHLLMNNTITSNAGGGIYEDFPSLEECMFPYRRVISCILWGNGDYDLGVGDAPLRTNYSDIGVLVGSTIQEGNISADPMFVKPSAGDYHLWADSPCIDTGAPKLASIFLPETDFDGNPRVVDGDGDGVAIVDMGAYENCGPSDVDGDGVPDLCDNCPDNVNPTQSDVDGDGMGDLCDECPGHGQQQCDPQGSIAEEIKKHIGGSVKTPDEKVEIKINPGDLEQDATISITKVTDKEPEVDLIKKEKAGKGKLLAAYEIKADTLTLKENASLTLVIMEDVTDIDEKLRDEVSLYLYDEAQQKFVHLEKTKHKITKDEQGNYKLTLAFEELKHFSLYAVVAPQDTDNDGIPDEFDDIVDACPSDPAGWVLTYTGPRLVAIEGETAMMTASALLTDENCGALQNVQVNFSVTGSVGNTHTCSAPTDNQGVASCSLSGLAPDVYAVVAEVEGQTGVGCPDWALAEAIVVVFDPSVPRATGGGFILPDTESTWPAESDSDRANFGFIVRLDKNQAAAGNLEFQYKTAGINLKSQSMAW